MDRGKARFREVGVLTKKRGGIDKRSKAYKRGEVTVDEYGACHGLKEKAQEISEIVTCEESTFESRRCG